MTYWSIKPNVIVQCFTGTQIPGIAGRVYPKEMCNNDKNGNRYPNGLMIYPEQDLEKLIKKFDATMCALAYSDLNYDTVQSLAARVNVSYDIVSVSKSIDIGHASNIACISPNTSLLGCWVQVYSVTTITNSVTFH